MAERPRRRRWRYWNNVLHRDLGYLAVAMTILYAVSGLAVNHGHDWNPNFRTVVVERAVTVPTGEPDQVVASLVEQLELKTRPREARWEGDDQVELVYAGWSVQVDLARGVATQETQKERPLLRRLNVLHLNDVRGLWTLVSDVYAVMLLVLAVTGMFVLKGKRGLSGRGKWLVLGGLAVPVAFLVLLA